MKEREDNVWQRKRERVRNKGEEREWEKSGRKKIQNWRAESKGKKKKKENF